MRARVSADDESERQARTGAGGSVARPEPRMLELQGRIGNRAVSRMIAPAVQRSSPMDLGSPLTPLPEELEEERFGQVISGHGRFDEEHLDAHPTARRKKAGTFTVPDGMTVVMYAPAGAYLNNDVANRVENHDPPDASELELKQTDSATTKPLPPGYPYTFTAGQEVVDYTVQPPDQLSIQGSPKTVTEPTPLRTLVAEARIEKHTKVHYACCSSGYSEKADFASLFPQRGWYVRFSTPT